MAVKKCFDCIIRIDEAKYKKDRIICKNCYNIKTKKYNKNTFSRYDNKKIKVVNSVNNTIKNKKKTKVVNSMNNRTLIIGFSNCRKTYLMNQILHRKQEPIFKITKSSNHYPNIEAQISNEIEPLENYEKSTVALDDMLLIKQESNLDMLFTRGRYYNGNNRKNTTLECGSECNFFSVNSFIWTKIGSVSWKSCKKWALLVI